MTTMTLTARPIETRLRPLYATGFILGALLSACVAHYASLRLEYFLTIPFTCCAVLHAAPVPGADPAPPGTGAEAFRPSRAVVRAVLQPKVALIVMCATLSMMVKRQ